MSDTLGLYIHIPFCRSKCPYCDFFSVRGKSCDYESYVNSLKNSIKIWSDKINKPVSSIYFGGGTPSVIGADLLCNILEHIKNNFNVTDDAEITFEVNPQSGKFFNFKKAKEAGFNRVSIGLQSANTDELKLLGRTHSVTDAENTIKLINDSCLKNYSMDLMIGIPNQTIDSLKSSIDFCIKNDVKHISSYILKIEENTVFYKRKNTLNLPDDDKTAELYIYATEYMNSKGYIQYEISNYAIPGFESKHNLKYWNLEEYLGLGPGAHSFINGNRFYFNYSFDEFKNNVTFADGNGGTEEEYIMLQLRLKKGLNIQKYKEIFGHNLTEDFFEKVKKYEKLGLLKINDSYIRLTVNGFLVSNTIISDII